MNTFDRPLPSAGLPPQAKLNWDTTAAASPPASLLGWPIDPFLPPSSGASECSRPATLSAPADQVLMTADHLSADQPSKVLTWAGVQNFARDPDWDFARKVRDDFAARLVRKPHHFQAVVMVCPHGLEMRELAAECLKEVA